MEIFSARLKWLRTSKGFTQAKIAEIVDMSAPGYTKIENGQREPNLDTLVKISTALNESSDFLIGITHHDKRSVKLLATLKTSKDDLEETHYMVELFLKEEDKESEIIKINLERAYLRIKSRNEIIEEIKKVLLIHFEEIPFFPQSLIDELKGE